MTANATPMAQPPGIPMTTSVAVPAAPPVPPVPPAPLPRVSVRRIFLLTGLALLVLALCGALYFYVWHQGYYFYGTDDAAITGTTVAVAPLSAGTITLVYHGQGSAVHKGDAIVALRTPDGGTEKARSPINGTIIQESALPGEVAPAGQALAQVVDLSKVYITAYVEETHIQDVHPGEGVDAHPGRASRRGRGCDRRLHGRHDAPWHSDGRPAGDGEQLESAAHDRLRERELHQGHPAGAGANHPERRRGADSLPWRLGQRHHPPPHVGLI